MSDNVHRLEHVHKGNPPLDRRTQRSIRTIKQSLLALINDVGFRNVTVANIAGHANVGRSTFYLHFKDKEDVLRQSLDDLHGALENASRAAPRSMGPCVFGLLLLRHVDENRKLWRALAGDQGEEIVKRRLRLVLSRLFTADPEYRLSDSVHDAARVQVLAGGFMGLLIWWLDLEPELTAEEVHQVFLNCVQQPGST